MSIYKKTFPDFTAIVTVLPDDKRFLVVADFSDTGLGPVQKHPSDDPERDAGLYGEKLIGNGYAEIAPRAGKSDAVTKRAEEMYAQYRKAGGGGVLATVEYFREVLESTPDDNGGES